MLSNITFFSFFFSVALERSYLSRCSDTQACPPLQPHGLEHARPTSPSPYPELLKFMSIESVMPSKYLVLCRLLLLFPSTFPSIISNESALCIRWPKYWSFSISSSNDYAELIFLRIDWFDLLAVQGTLKSLLQHHSSKASIL